MHFDVQRRDCRSWRDLGGLTVHATSKVAIGPFSLDAPPGWALSTVILAGPVDALAPVSRMPETGAPPFQRNLVATREQVDSSVTPESYLERQSAGLRQAGVSRKLTRTAELVNLQNGGHGLLMEQVIEGPQGDLVGQCNWCACKMVWRTC
jgi:hypothetical protein